MWPDTGNAPKVGSFTKPMPLPTLDPDAAPTKSFSINCQWLPYIRGALEQLVLQSSWATNDPAALTLVQARAMSLINIFQECAVANVPLSCSGNLADSPNAFGTWSLFSFPPTIGHYVGGAGWESTDALIGDTTYDGIHVEVSFLQPCLISEFILNYDYTKGHVQSGSELAMYVFDLDNHVYFPGNLTFNDLFDGTGLHASFGPNVNQSAHYLIRLFAASQGGATPPSPSGFCRLTAAALLGSSNGIDQCQ